MALIDKWIHHQAVLGFSARQFDPAAKLKVKKGWLWERVSPGDNFAVTIGNTVYLPEGWSHDKVLYILPHEIGGHVKQFRIAGLGIHPILGIFPGMFLFYLLFPVPILFAWGRYRCELHAESAAWRKHLESGFYTIEDVLEKARFFSQLISGRAYWWAMPKGWARRGFLRRAQKIIWEYLDGQARS
jgi:hypothetical protein